MNEVVNEMEMEATKFSLRVSHLLNLLFRSPYILIHMDWAFSTCPPRIAQRIKHIPLFDTMIVHFQHMGGYNCPAFYMLLQMPAVLSFRVNN
jgi:hypothetical protein